MAWEVGGCDMRDCFCVDSNNLRRINLGSLSSTMSEHTFL